VYTAPSRPHCHFPTKLSNHSANHIVARGWNGAQGYLIKRSAYAENLHMERTRWEKEMLEREAAVAKKRQKEYQDRSMLGRRGLNKLNKELNRRLAPGGNNRDVEQLKERTSSLLKTLATKATENMVVLRPVVSTVILANNRLASMRDIGYETQGINDLSDDRTVPNAEPRDWEGEESTGVKDAVIKSPFAM
jgi:hypothetical protein